MTIQDLYRQNSSGLTTPAVRHSSVTPSDSEDLSWLPRALYIGGSGTIAMHDIEGTAVTYTVSAGSIIPLRARRVLSAGTTATNIVAWE
jgi:hypothetical protein